MKYIHLIINQYLHLYESKAVFFASAFSSSNLYFHIRNAFCILKLFGKRIKLFIVSNSSFLAVAVMVTIRIFSLGKYLIYLFSLFMALILF